MAIKGFYSLQALGERALDGGPLFLDAPDLTGKNFVFTFFFTRSRSNLFDFGRPKKTQLPAERRLEKKHTSRSSLMEHPDPPDGVVTGR